MNKDAADMISKGVRSGQTITTLAVFAEELEDWARGIKPQVPQLARWLHHLAHELRARHDHADPCEVGSDCPCCKHGQDYARDNIEPPCRR